MLLYRLHPIKGLSGVVISINYYSLIYLDKYLSARTIICAQIFFRFNTTAVLNKLQLLRHRAITMFGGSPVEDPPPRLRPLHRLLSGRRHTTTSTVSAARPARPAFTSAPPWPINKLSVFLLESIIIYFRNTRHSGCAITLLRQVHSITRILRMDISSPAK
jgi:hypothetical protein